MRGNLKQVYEICAQPDELPFINFQKGTAVAINYYPDGEVLIAEEHLKLGDHIKQALKQRGMKIVSNANKADVVISVCRVGAIQPEIKVKAKRTENSISWIFPNEYKATISVYDRKRETVDRYAYKRPYVEKAILLEKDPVYQFSFDPKNQESWKELSWIKEPQFESSTSEKELSAHHVAVKEKLEKIMMRLMVENQGKSPVFDKGDTMGILYRDEVVPAVRHCRGLGDEPGSKLAVYLLKVLKKEGVRMIDPTDEATMVLCLPLPEGRLIGKEQKGSDLIKYYNTSQIIRLIDQKNGCHLDGEWKMPFEFVEKGILVQKGKWSRLCK